MVGGWNPPSSGPNPSFTFLGSSAQIGSPFTSYISSIYPSSTVSVPTNAFIMVNLYLTFGVSSRGIQFYSMVKPFHGVPSSGGNIYPHMSIWKSWQLIVDGMVKNQELMMNRIVNLERTQQQAPRVPYKGQFQKGNQVFRPKNDQEVPNTLAPSNVVDENPWCMQCSESHWEHECPYNNGGHDQVNIMDHTIEDPQICLNISPEEHQEGIKEEATKARMEVINNLDQESREKLKKQEFQVYTR
jgi:hypothetical protein